MSDRSGNTRTLAAAVATLVLALAGLVWLQSSAPADLEAPGTIPIDGEFLLTFRQSRPASAGLNPADPPTTEIRMRLAIDEQGDVNEVLGVVIDQADGKVISDSNWLKSGGPRLVRNFVSCQRDELGTPTPPNAADLFADTIGPLASFDQYGYHREGDMWVGSEGSFSIEIHGGDASLGERVFEIRNPEGTLTVRIDSITLREFHLEDLGLFEVPEWDCL
ncbi:MAG: hypothetical protein GY788_11270 [bacterium]|nr:hypothetical protein [bacterium]